MTVGAPLGELVGLLDIVGFKEGTIELVGGVEGCEEGRKLAVGAPDTVGLDDKDGLEVGRCVGTQGRFGNR